MSRKAIKTLLFCIVNACLLLTSAAADGPAKVLRWKGSDITGINEVKLRDDARVQILHSRGAFSAAIGELPVAFLASWGLSTNSVEERRVARQNEALAGFEPAVRSGLFREVDGVVYDLRKYQPEWSYFSQAKLVRFLKAGALFDVSSDPNTMTFIVVTHLSELPRAAQRLDINAKLVSSIDYLDDIGNVRKLRLFDVGRRCGREEIPEAITRDGQTCASLVEDSLDRGVLAKLPDGQDLKGNGTGFFISEDGYLLTNAHVVEDAQRVKVRTKRGVLPAEIIEINKREDLALLKVAGKFQSLPIADDSSAGLGDTVFTIGFPNISVQGLEPKFTDGKISSLSGMRDDPITYQVSVPVQSGNSGGPLVNQQGQVVGVIVAKLNDMAMLRSTGSVAQNVNYAVKVRYLRKLLAKHPEAIVATKKPAVQGQEAVKLVEQSVAMVLIY